MADHASAYLVALQTAYRIDNIDVAIDVFQTPIIVLAANPWRIYLHLSCIGVGVNYLSYRTQSGILVPIGPVTETTSLKLTMAYDYVAPTLEIVSSNTLVMGSRIVGFAVVKI